VHTLSAAHVPDDAPIDELARLELEALNAASAAADEPVSQAGVNHAPPPPAAEDDPPPSTLSSPPPVRHSSPAPVEPKSPVAAAPVTIKSLLIKVQELTDRVAQVERNEWLLKRENMVFGRHQNVCVCV
jgi:hypothetical protein